MSDRDIEGTGISYEKFLDLYFRGLIPLHACRKSSAAIRYRIEGLTPYLCSRWACLDSV